LKSREKKYLSAFRPLQPPLEALFPDGLIKIHLGNLKLPEIRGRLGGAYVRVCVHTIPFLLRQQSKREPRSMCRAFFGDSSSFPTGNVCDGHALIACGCLLPVISLTSSIRQRSQT